MIPLGKSCHTTQNTPLLGPNKKWNHQNTWHKKLQKKQLVLLNKCCWHMAGSDPIYPWPEFCLGGGGGGQRAFALPPHALQGRLEEEEVCTRRRIGELHAAVVELLLQGFREGGCAFLTPPPL